MKRAKKKRYVALLLSAVMALSSVPAVPLTVAAAEEMTVVAEYDMSHSGTQLTDQSGNGNHAVLVGFGDSDFSTSGGDTILNFTGDKSKYVELPGGLIEAEQFSITAEFTAAKTGGEGENSWLFCLGSEVGVWPNVKNYVFLCPAQGSTNGNNATGMLRAGIMDASTELRFDETHAVVSGTNTVEITFDNGTLTLSLNGTEIDTIESGYSIQSILENGASDTIMGYIGKSLYSEDPAFSGTLTHFKIEAVDLDDMETAVNSLELPYNTTDKQVYGNITLPTSTKNGAAVTWQTSHPAIVDVSSHANSGYDATPAGTVTRPAADTDVTMTATISLDGQSETKTFTFTVKAAPEELAEDDYTDYFFAYFAGEGYSDGEQIYFAASEDGLNWKDLNDNNPVLTSSLGEKGVRDPYIIRSAEGDKFYMIATDLKIYEGNGWSAAQSAGSQSIMVWESVDLVNWSEQRMVEISASIDAGCTWAPECYYDDITGEYVVYWASKVADDSYAKQRVYYAKTRDFYSFTEPKVFIDYDESSIDTTIIYDETTGYYYRYTKNEGGSTNDLGAITKSIFVERSKSILGSWEFIASNTLNSSDNQYVEGPAIFEFCSDDTANGQYCLLVDDFGGIGYYPLVSSDLSDGEFSTPSAAFKMPTRARHGTPIPITRNEYTAVMKKWGGLVEENTEAEQMTPKLTYTFEQTEEDTSLIVDDSGSGNNGTLYGNADIVYDTEKQSNVLYLNGTSGTYAALPTGFFDGRNTVTISMDVKAASTSGNFFTFTVGKSDTKYYFLKTNQAEIKSVITTGSWGSEKGVWGAVDSVLNTWLNLTVVIDGSSMRVYVNGKLAGENTDIPYSFTDLGSSLESYLGKSFYGGDGYFNGYFDNINVYNRALTPKEIVGSEPLAEYLFDNADLTNTGTSGNQATTIVTGLGAYTGTVAWTTGRDGTGSAIDLGDYGLMLNETGIGNEYTVSLWVKPDSTVTVNSPIAALGYHNPENWMAVSGASNPATDLCKFWGNGGAFSTWTTATELSVLAEWTHLAFVGVKDKVTLYVNGAVVGTYTSNNPLAVDGGDVLVGANYWDAEFAGMADDIKVYARPLSAGEVYRLYDDSLTAESQLEEEGFVAPESMNLAVGLTDILAIELPELVAEADDLQITYSSSKPAVVKIDTNGTLTAESEGTAVITITVTLGDVTKTAITAVNVLANVESLAVATYPFDDQTLDNASSDDADDKATAVYTGLSEYTGDVLYETGMASKGYAVRIGEHGLKLNQKNLGTDFTVSMWIKLDQACSENQVLLFMGYHNPENWMAVSGDTKDAPYKFWGKGGIFGTWTTSAAPEIEAEKWQNLVFTGVKGKITAYINGENLGTFDSNDPLSGTNADIYIGVNNWDIEAVGLVDNINVYNTQLSETVVKDCYNKAVLEMAAVELEEMMADTAAVKENFTLPTIIEDVTISWATSDSGLITKNGVVTRPQEEDGDKTVTLTATLTVNGTSVTKDFSVTVLALDTAGDMADAAKALLLPEVITEDMNLPTAGKFGTTITWSSSEPSILANDGTIVNRPGVGEGNAAVLMTATLELNGTTFTKEYEVEVMEEFYGYILSYTTGTNDLTGSLHLAYSTDGKNFTALNSNTGILFIAVDTNNGNASLSTGYRYTDTHLFRKTDGSFGFVSTVAADGTSVYLYDSKDLITYTGERAVDTKSNVGNLASAEVAYDILEGAYRVNWTNTSGTEYSGLTTDLQTLNAASRYDFAADTSANDLTTVPAGAVKGNVIGVTKAEYDKIVKKLGVVENTGVEEPETIRVKVGDTVELPKTLTAYYSDDSTTNMSVTWNTDGIDFTKAGTYTVSGTIDQEIYANPLIEQRADPHIEYDPDEDCYYFTASYPAYYNVDGGYDRIALRKSNSIAGLTNAADIAIWTAPASGAMAKHVWAPEIHQIEDKWYVFFAAGNSDNVWAIRPYVLVCQNNSDPYNASSWVDASGNAVIHAADSIASESQYFNQMSLDMTYYEHNGHHYVIWADIIGQSALYMQEVNPDAPWQGISKVILLTTPEYAWERDLQRVNEGASVIKNNGKIYVTFSASGTGPEYCIGLLSMDENDDPLDVNAWTKVCYPVLTSSDVPGEYGPGHNSFTVDENGNAVFVYHARSEECYNNQCKWASSDSLYDPCRHARVKRVHWAADGTPILNMSYEEELKAEYANVTITIIVEGTDKSALEAEIAIANTLVESDYSAETWSAYEAVLAQAIDAYKNTDATQEAVNEICDKLSEARSALVNITSTEILAELVANVYVMIGKTDSASLDKQMWTALISEVKAADEILAADAPKQSDVDKAYENLLSMKNTVWPTKYTVTVVEGGLLESGVNSSAYYAMEMATVVADAVNESGAVFAYWMDIHTGEAISYVNKYTFYVLSDMDLKAVYTTDEFSVEEKISISCDAVYDETLQRVVFTVRRILPIECTVTEHGILITKSDVIGRDEAAFTLDDTTNVKSVSRTGGEVNGLATVKVNAASGTTCYARGYVKYTYSSIDANGLETVNEGLVYGEIGYVTVP